MAPKGAVARSGQGIEIRALLITNKLENKPAYLQARTGNIGLSPDSAITISGIE